MVVSPTLPQPKKWVVAFTSATKVGELSTMGVTSSSKFPILLEQAKHKVVNKDSAITFMILGVMIIKGLKFDKTIYPQDYSGERRILSDSSCNKF